MFWDDERAEVWGDITQVGKDQMGDAVAGSEFYRVGDRLQVKKGGP